MRARTHTHTHIHRRTHTHTHTHTHKPTQTTRARARPQSTMNYVHKRARQPRTLHFLSTSFLRSLSSISLKEKREAGWGWPLLVLERSKRWGDWPWSRYRFRCLALSLSLSLSFSLPSRFIYSTESCHWLALHAFYLLMGKRQMKILYNPPPVHSSPAPPRFMEGKPTLTTFSLWRKTTSKRQPTLSVIFLLSFFFFLFLFLSLPG